MPGRTAVRPPGGTLSRQPPGQRMQERERVAMLGPIPARMTLCDRARATLGRTLVPLSRAPVWAPRSSGGVRVRSTRQAGAGLTHGAAVRELADLLARRGDLEEAEQILGPHANAGAWIAAALLADRGDLAGLCSVIRPHARPSPHHVPEHRRRRACRGQDGGTSLFLPGVRRARSARRRRTNREDQRLIVVRG